MATLVIATVVQFKSGSLLNSTWIMSVSVSSVSER